jgi:mono/diheme cytochrome c family protein
MTSPRREIPKRVLLSAVTAVAAWLICQTAAIAQLPDGGDEYLDRVVPFVRSHCADCHGEDDPAAELNLLKWATATAAKADRASWERVRRVLSRHEMPPVDQERPPSEEIKSVVAWIDAAVLGIDCSRPQPGRVTIRRLNRQEYRNTIRDLLGVNVSVDRFPVDPSGHGFDTIGDVLSMPPVLVERYLDAAEAALAEAIVAPEDLQNRTHRYPLDELELGYNAKAQGDGGVALTSVEEDDIVALHWVPIDSDYVLRVSASARPKRERPLELTFLLGEQAVETLKVAPDDPQTYEVKIRAPRGRQSFRVSMRRIKVGLSPEQAAVWKKGPQQEGTIFVHWLEIEGPLNADPAKLPQSHRRIFAAADQKDDQEAAARAILGSFAERAYRRPVESHDVDRLVQLALAEGSRGASFEAGIRASASAVLVSPRFLFRSELPVTEGKVDSAEAPRIVLLDEFALASRLSYFLWSSMPDEALFADARAGKLRANLQAQVRRMLADPKSQSLVENFAGQWFELRNLTEVAPTPRQFPEFDGPLRDAMRRETELLFENVVREDRPITELLSADYSFVNERLAKHYGLSGVEGDEFRRVSLADTERRGVLSHASVWTLSSNPTRTSPVKRGKWVLENLLAAPPPPPPPNVPELEKTPDVDQTLSLRQRMEQHRQNPTCASCHQRMDAIGFALEHFDAIGRWRDTDGKAAIDSSGEIFAGRRFDGAKQLVELLNGPERERFLNCAAEKMLIFALGRGLEYFDTCAVDKIVEETQRNENRFSSQVMAVVESVPFQYVQLPGSE